MAMDEGAPFMPKHQKEEKVFHLSVLKMNPLRKEGAQTFVIPVRKMTSLLLHANIQSFFNYCPL